MFKSVLFLSKIIWSFCLIIFVFIGCNQSKESGSEEIKNKRWVLFSMPGRDSVIITESGKDVFLSLDNSSNAFNGQAPCNQYFGTYKINDNSITFSDIGATRMACDNLDIESEYFENLRKANKFKVNNERLFLYKDDTILLRFKAVWLE